MKRMLRISLCFFISINILCFMFSFVAVAETPTPTPIKNENSSTPNNVDFNQSKIDEIVDKRMDHHLQDIKDRLNSEIKQTGETSYHFIVFSSLLVGVVSIVVVIAGVLTGYSVSKTAKEIRDKEDALSKKILDYENLFREALDKHNSDFKERIQEIKENFQKELSLFNKNAELMHEKNKSKIDELEKTDDSLHKLDEKINLDFKVIEDKFNKMEKAFEPAEKIINQIQMTYIKPETLMNKIMLEVLTLLMDNTTFSDEYRQEIKNRFKLISEKLSEDSRLN